MGGGLAGGGGTTWLDTDSRARKVDKDFIPGLMYIRDNEATSEEFEAMGLPFTVPSASGQDVQLSSRHSHISLDTRAEYVRLAVSYRCVRAVGAVGRAPGRRPAVPCTPSCPVPAELLVTWCLPLRLHEFDEQVAAVREGMARVVPVPLLSLFTGYELETMVGGSAAAPPAGPFRGDPLRALAASVHRALRVWGAQLRKPVSCLPPGAAPGPTRVPRPRRPGWWVLSRSDGQGPPVCPQVCGSPDIPLHLLKSVATYKGVEPSAPLVQWFWEVMEAFSNTERSLFLRFVWGRTRLPRTIADFRGRDFVIQVGSRGSGSEGRPGRSPASRPGFPFPRGWGFRTAAGAG